ncbi:MAG: polysaccharide deacetylase family protein [Prevotellaceae bacterium]|jgi:peptidoglycan/xylan/chitin deacetylase (PgdA/CDA1 family)|nr:polysaccharide deacetylase family protein [Prevotellaceae bacterium]
MLFLSISAVILILFLLAFFFYASYSISSGVYVKAYCKKNTAEKEVALTFDDGPDAKYTPRILDLLKQRNIEAAFFCIGSETEKNPELIERMFTEGHLIGNHSYLHIHSFPISGAKKMIADIQRCEDAITAVTHQPVRFFRPPFGITNPLVRKALKSFDYYTIGWNIRSLDTTTGKVDKIVGRVIKRIRPGSVILLHDRLPYSAHVLEKILTYLSENNYTVKRVDKLFNITV